MKQKKLTRNTVPAEILIVNNITNFISLDLISYLYN